MTLMKSNQLWQTTCLNYVVVPVIIVFKAKKDNIYYVAKIFEEILDDEEDFDFFVTFLKLTSKLHEKLINP